MSWVHFIIVKDSNQRFILYFGNFLHNVSMLWYDTFKYQFKQGLSMKQNRINEIETYLIQKKSASMTELCDKFNISQNTARRDIAELCSRGVASKVYGGIILNTENDIVPYNMRSVSNLSEKMALAQIASKYIKEGETIYIDSGTTTVNMLQYIPENINLTIISNSLNVYNEAARFAHLNVISTGGLLYHKTNSFIGMTAINTLRDYHINKAFMAATGVSLDSGAMNNSFHEAEIKKAVTRQCKAVILMADYTKIEKPASIAFSPLESLHAFITDKKPPNEYMDFFNTHNIDCSYPES